MLTDIDVHYLVGLLTRISETNDVDIELGAMVYDKAGDKDREVDITIRYKNLEGVECAFRAIEIKDHSKASRKMGIQEVEGLCQKFQDMESVTHKGIVSSTGYTKGAIKKAAFHGVELFELLSWNDPSIGFDHVKFAHNFNISERHVSWIDKVNIRLIPEDSKRQFNPADVTKILGSHGKQFSNLHALQVYLADFALKSLNEQIPPNTEKLLNININITIADDLFLEICGELIKIKSAQIQGKAICIEKKLQPEFKIIKKLGEGKPFVGCFITEFANGNLMGFAVSNTHKNVQLINIPLTERTKKKIYKQKLRDI